MVQNIPLAPAVDRNGTNPNNPNNPNIQSKK
jgi:hypothetical protein